ncbi:dATP/dGTP diphosphohydrolase domain-containing protein [Mesorhizobium sp. B2-4-1]|uniref:dATP/dGTP diphosphohydrolase domain-containing protein n=1 Tax=Mesorhizobium sp. B2-4-1 TaxID=2589948 RepID=UPI00112CD025|nr:dATP/dGTP diphosphohydrolase domain-containing protein [Mesorhizobium sp. B2-4-1]TPL66643.1 hypothetical protein FJ949_09770 [Mesorhizobium sp. B2-4-1]
MSNPKQAFGDKKPPLGYFPLSAKLACMEALYDGLLKYDPHNWRDTQVEAMTYVEAALRHLELYKVGEELTRDTLVKNLGAVMACCTILIDAAAHGTLIDNRRHSPVEADLLHQGEEWVERLKAVHKERLRQRQQDELKVTIALDEISEETVRNLMGEPPVNDAPIGTEIPIVEGSVAFDGFVAMDGSFPPWPYNPPL